MLINLIDHTIVLIDYFLREMTIYWYRGHLIGE